MAVEAAGERRGPDRAGAHLTVLIVFARAPSASGKTRLTSHLTLEQARALRTALLLDTLDIARSIGVSVCVRYTPSDAREEMAALVGDVMLAPQTDDDLGARMLHAVSSSFAGGASALVLIGSDLPTLPPDYLIAAFRRLETADCVFGPADDGGYYLVGLSRRAMKISEDETRVARLFTHIEWGTHSVLQQSLAAARDAGLSAELLPSWYDVDHFDDLTRVGADTQAPAVRTRGWCRRFSTAKR